MQRFNKCSDLHHHSAENWKQILIEVCAVKYWSLSCNKQKLNVSIHNSSSPQTVHFQTIRRESLSSYDNILTLCLVFSDGDVAFLQSMIN